MKFLFYILTTSFWLISVCKIFVNAPISLKQKINNLNNSIPFSFANYGKIPYGHKIIGRYFYYPSNPYAWDNFFN